MASKPLLIADWTDIQIEKYCDACGISFTDSVNDCIKHIRMLESSQIACSKGTTSTSLEVRGN